MLNFIWNQINRKVPEKEKQKWKQKKSKVTGLHLRLKHKKNVQHVRIKHKSPGTIL